MKGPNEDCMANETQTKPAQKLTRKEIASIMAGLMVAMFPGALDTTIIGPAMPTIGRELGDVEHLPWIVTSYLLVSTAATPLYGKLSDIHGRRIMLLNYGNRNVEGLRVRLLGRFPSLRLHSSAGAIEPKDLLVTAETTEFSLPLVPTYAVIDLKP